jgi:catalase
MGSDRHRRFPQWDLGIQVFDQAFAEAQPYDVLDATKLIPEEDVPVRVIGTLTLNRNPDNFFAETEQVAFLPTNIVPGIDFTNDPLLQGRLFSYLDTQKSRLGTTNFHQIPINAPRCPFANFQRDGLMQTQVPKGRANYEPNSLAEHGEEGGPRASMERGFVTTNAATGADEEGDKLRVRAELFGTTIARRVCSIARKQKASRRISRRPMSSSCRRWVCSTRCLCGWSPICATSTRTWRAGSLMGWESIFPSPRRLPGRRSIWRLRMRCRSTRT